MLTRKKKWRGHWYKAAQSTWLRSYVQREGTISSVTIASIYYTSQFSSIYKDNAGGRHGDKGIISKILSRQDKSYLQEEHHLIWSSTH